MKPVIPAGFTVLVVASMSLAGPMKEPYKGSAEFERIKTLTGTWKAADQHPLTLQRISPS